MMSITRSTAFAVLSAGLLAANPLSAATRTVTGIVSDAKCGAMHPSADAAKCTRDCVKKGSDYALVVDGAVYTLKADAAAKEKLQKRVGKGATVMGDFQDMTVTVASVTTPKKIRKH
jgi:hypothetical protein